MNSWRNGFVFLAMVLAGLLIATLVWWVRVQNNPQIHDQPRIAVTTNEVGIKAVYRSGNTVFVEIDSTFNRRSQLSRVNSAVNMAREEVDPGYYQVTGIELLEVRGVVYGVFVFFEPVNSNQCPGVS